MKKYLLIILLTFTGCSRWFSYAETPFLAGTVMKVPEGTPIFQKGFKNGCATSLSARASGFYRDRYKHYYDPKLIDNPEYKFGYSRGYGYCFQYTVAGGHTLLGSADTYIYARGTPFSMGTGDWQDTINYGKGNWSNPFGFSGGGIDSIWSVVQKGKGGGNGPSTNKTAEGESAFSGHPLWGTWQNNQIFGQ
jgi:hypothetical protein